MLPSAINITPSNTQPPLVLLIATPMFIMNIYIVFQENPTAISITAVLVEYQTKTGRTMKGVATDWLSHMKPDNGNQYRVPIYVRKSQFRLPFKTNMPVLMIGPGTGLAPFRGFLQERHYLKGEGSHIVIFVCLICLHL